MGTNQYCIECGTELPEGASFCSECGAEIDGSSGAKEDRREDMDELRRLADIATEDSKVRPEVLAQIQEPKFWLSGSRSEGNYMVYDEPLITYVDPDEEVKYLLINKTSGPKIIGPDGEKRTPHSGGRYKFLLFTDRRVIYVAAHGGENIVRDWDYSEITMNIDGMKAHLSRGFKFQTDDGYTYIFKDQSSMKNFLKKDVAKYVSKKADGSNWEQLKDAVSTSGGDSEDSEDSSDGMGGLAGDFNEDAEDVLPEIGPGMNPNQSAQSKRNQAVLVLYLLTFPISIPYLLYKYRQKRSDSA